MADLNDILTNVRAEIVKAIVGISVRERGAGEASFVYQPQTYLLTPETASRTRAFSVRLAEIQSKWCGVSLQRYDVTFEVKIGYPLNDWEIAMASDYDQIRTAINSSAGRGAVTGVGYRVVDRDGFKIAQTEDWQFATIKISSIVETQDSTNSAGVVIVDSFQPGQDGIAYWSYCFIYGSIVRMGTICTCWDVSAGTVDTWTTRRNITGTSASTDCVFSVDMTAANGNVRLLATSTLYAWTIRVSELAM